MGDEFMAVGGIAINMATISQIEEKITQIRDRLSLTHEIKWSNVKARRDNGHLAYAELLHELVEANNIHFHMRFQRIQEWDHQRSGPRRKVDTVSRAYYQLSLHRPVAFYGAQADLHLRPDNGECTSRLHEFIGHLNTQARKHKDCGVECVKSIQATDSKNSHPHQLLDVTLGGLAAVRNRRHLRDDISEAKRTLALSIHELWGNLDLTESSTKDEKRFNIWNAQPRK